MSSTESTSRSAASTFSAQGDLNEQISSSGQEKPAGELLRSARESAGLHIAALAVMLKVPVKKLEALESSRFDLLPDMVFVRALACSVCRTLKIDSAPILDRLPQTGTPHLMYPAGRISTPFRSSGDLSGASGWSGLPKPAIFAVLFLLLASLAVFFWPAVSAQFNQLTAAIQARTGAGNGSADVAPVTAELELRGEKAIRAAMQPAASASGATISPDANQAAGSASSAELNASGTTTPSLSAAASSLVDVPANSLIVFRAVGQSWIEVTDAKRQTVLRRTLAAGESVGVTGALPLSATVGSASMTRVDVRGQGFDLAPWSKDNVARFEVK